jgi:hypothetical protein
VPWNQPIEVPSTKEILVRGKRVIGTIELGGRFVFNNNFSYCKALGQNS